VGVLVIAKPTATALATIQDARAEIRHLKRRLADKRLEIMVFATG
jgi:hypothetical protein